MTARKIKHARMMEKRAKWEDEIKERNNDWLKKEQTRRAEEKKKADEKRKERAVAKSKRLAKQHKDGIKEYKPAEKSVRDVLRPKRLPSS